jgi:1-deoxy-D-xylulose-5-phosphate synthase
MLERINSPADLRGLDYLELATLAQEIREFIVDAVSITGGHLGSNLGAVELTLAVHRVFDSPKDIILWDTGHQAYVHKIVTGRQAGFAELRQAGGLSGYPSRAESEHDWVENSHASTILSYAHGVATAVETRGLDRRVVAIIGDGSMTGGMAFEGLNNLGHSHRRVVIILNDNGRSYAPTISLLSESLTRLRLNPGWVAARTRLGEMVRDLPAVGNLASASLQGLRSAIREVLEPPVFFEALGVRYTGPIDGHDVAGMEHALRNAASYDGPIVVHVLTEKGKGYPPAEDDEIQNLHDLKVAGPNLGDTVSYTDAFSEALIEVAGRDDRIVAITAAMPGPTGLLPFQAKYPERCFDVGIAEQHAVTSAAGMAMGGLRPVVAVYSTFLSRAFDQANLDVGLHGLPVVFALDRAGITGDDGPSHHGVLDLALCLKIPGMTVFAPSSAAELTVMLRHAVTLDGPASIRWPKTPSPVVRGGNGHVAVGRGLEARRCRTGDGEVCILAVGKMLAAAEEAADLLARSGITATVWDVRVVRPADPAMLADAAGHTLVVTVEDGIRLGGAGSFLADALGGSVSGNAGGAVLVLGTPVDFIPQGKPAAILRRLGLDGPGVAASISQALGARATL